MDDSKKECILGLRHTRGAMLGFAVTGCGMILIAPRIPFGGGTIGLVFLLLGVLIGLLCLVMAGVFAEISLRQGDWVGAIGLLFVLAGIVITIKLFSALSKSEM